jgi:dienelactone hydrolase
MSDEPPFSSALVDGIPVIWAEPDDARTHMPLVLWLPYLTGSKESTKPFLADLVRAGFTALSFDPWQHGERGTEEPDALTRRVFGDFRRHMWPILGQTTLDMLRVIDWSSATFGAERAVYAGGTSMGGDIAVTAAGIDARIQRVAAIVATPDWLRPGMRSFPDFAALVPPGEPDGYARFFYDYLNPLSHLEAYTHGTAIAFECGAEDRHVPPDGAQRFRAALHFAFPEAAGRIRVTLHPGVGHETTPAMQQRSIDWFLRPDR